MCAQIELAYLIRVTLSAEGSVIVIPKARRRWAAERHAAHFVDVVTIGTRSRSRLEMRGRQKVARGVPAMIQKIRMTRCTGRVAFREGQPVGIVDKESKAPAVPNMGQTRAVAGLARNSIVRALQVLQPVAGAPPVVARQTRGRTNFIRSQTGLLASISAQPQRGDDRKAHR